MTPAFQVCTRSRSVKAGTRPCHIAPPHSAASPDRPCTATTAASTDRCLHRAATASRSLALMLGASKSACRPSVLDTSDRTEASAYDSRCARRTGG